MQERERIQFVPVSCENKKIKNIRTAEVAVKYAFGAKRLFKCYVRSPKNKKETEKKHGRKFQNV